MERQLKTKINGNFVTYSHNENSTMLICGEKQEHYHRLTLFITTLDILNDFCEVNEDCQSCKVVDNKDISPTFFEMVCNVEELIALNNEIYNSQLIWFKSEREEPDFCKEKYLDKCDECEFITCEIVGHPGGSSVHSAEKHSCDLGHWEDNF